ncbi:MAG: DUF3021 domain-containing protein [Clostridiales bacterium]|nr:DUF3021 domain-containing protein [Clostridiales bacterium]
MSYIKEGTRRGLIGILMGLFLSYTMFLLASLQHDVISIESSVFIKQYMMYAISGFYFAFISIIFSIEEWSVLKQFITHVLSTLPFLPIAHMIGMMPQNTMARVSFIGFYLSGYAISFIIYKIYLKKQAQLINASL